MALAAPAYSQPACHPRGTCMPAASSLMGCITHVPRINERH